MICSNIEDQRKRKYAGGTSEPARDGKWHNWLHIIFASLLYVLANLVDYFFTLYGIAKNVSQEANPVVQGYMDVFGVGRGLAICKLLMGAIIILGVIAIRLAYRRRGSEVRVELLLYAGSFMTLLGGSLWLTRLL